MPTSLDRRRFLARSAASAAALLAAREGLALPAEATPATAAPPATAPVARLGQNENPWGSSVAAKKAAIEDDAAFLEACRKRTVAGREGLAAFLRE